MNRGETIEKLPDGPGVYLMKDANGNIIYVGKASSLKNRVKSYFQESSFTSPKVMAISSNTAKIDYLITKSELEALILESNLIKKYKPRYNVMYKDDKSYPFLKLTVNEEIPRLVITRKILNDKAMYFGPYVIGSLRRMLKAVHKYYKICDLNVPIDAKIKRPCLKEQIGTCAGICVGKISKTEYLKIVDEVKKFLNGKQKELIQDIEKKMLKSSENTEYEQAAKYRDQLEEVKLLYKHAHSEVKLTNDAKDKWREKFLQAGLLELQRKLGLNKLPDLIEAFDISNFAGKEPTGSLIVFLNGKPLKSEYRHFKVRTVFGIDDYAMLSEVVERRYKRLLDENKRMPDLILIDGGVGHLSIVKNTMDRLGLKINIISLAKRKEEVFLPNAIMPIRLKKDSAALHILQYIRDEAHRFALKHHRILSRKKMKESVLDDIKGIRTARKNEILKYFGSVDKLKDAKEEDILKVPKMTTQLAKKIYEFFRWKK